MHAYIHTYIHTYSEHSICCAVTSLNGMVWHGMAWYGMEDGICMFIWNTITQLQVCRGVVSVTWLSYNEQSMGS